METPPCLIPGHAPNGCARNLYEIEVHQKQDFTGFWLGWKMRGRELVSPDGDRISVERLRGILVIEDSRKRFIKHRLQDATWQPGVVVPFSRVDHPRR